MWREAKRIDLSNAESSVPVRSQDTDGAGDLTPEQWKEVKDLFSQALDCEASQRKVFLTQVCDSESVVGAEVHRLLSEHESLESPTVQAFMQQPAFKLVEAVVSSSKTEYLWRHLNDYRILSRLGSGGMADVYRAHDEKLGREVAIKVLRDHSTLNRDQIDRFRSEARILGRLNHPQIGLIHNFEDEEGTYFLVLELVGGETLAERIARGPVPLKEALDIGSQIAEALEAAASEKIVHLDLKPANIKITPNGVVKVLDFGIARILARANTATDGGRAETVSQDPAIIAGTPLYMSPEQVRGGPVDCRADIWAWGCVMYEMLTGQPAFGDDRTSEVVKKVVASEPDWSRLHVPASIHALLRSCLEKDAAHRFQHIAQLRAVIADQQAPAARSKDSQRYWLAVLVLGTLAVALAMFALIVYWEAK